MHPIRMMGRLAASSQSYSVGSSGVQDSIPLESMVAGALGMGQLGRGAELVGLLVFADQHDCARELVTRLSAAGAQRFESNGWKVDYCYGIAEMLVFEILWPRRCVDCKGEGRYSVRLTALGPGRHVVARTQNCDRCRGTGRGMLSGREQARIAGIEQSRFSRTWAPRVHEMRLILAGWEAECLRHLARHFEEINEAS